jgi:hypothetical protein
MPRGRHCAPLPPPCKRVGHVGSSCTELPRAVLSTHVVGPVVGCGARPGSSHCVPLTLCRSTRCIPWSARAHVLCPGVHA